MLNRTHYWYQIYRNPNPITALLGPRQCGKTTLAKQIMAKTAGPVHMFDLEDDDDAQTLQHPKLILDKMDGLIIIDEVQRAPHLFPYLRTLVDRKPDIKVLLLGSASRMLIETSSESLAGRIRYIEITPFSGKEIYDLDLLWIRGGFPKSYLAKDNEESVEWRKDYIRTFLEHDIPALGFKLNPQQLRRFWMMLCDYHANIFSASELARGLNLDHKTVKSYVDILAGTFMVRPLQPWFASISKRQIKSYKVYFRDSGLFHTLADLHDPLAVRMSRKVGASWEGFALEQIIACHQYESENCFFWSTQSGAEVDLLVVQGHTKQAYEFKYSSTPKTTKSMHSALETLGLDHMTVIIPGDAHYFLHEKIEVFGLKRYFLEHSVLPT